MTQTEAQMAASKYKIASIDAKMAGDEPIYPGHVTNTQLARALNWYNYMYGPIYSGVDAKAKKWLISYLRENRPDDVARLSKVPDHAIVSTICFLARMMSHGSILSEQTMHNFNIKLEEILSYRKKVDSTQVKETSTPRPSVVDRTARKTERLLQEIEETVDNLWDRNFQDVDFSLYNFLNANEAAPASIKAILEYYTKSLKAVESDKEYINKVVYPRITAFYKDLIADCDRMINNKKIVRKPRAKKVVDTEKVVSGVKYMKKFDPLKLVSINPVDILGAKQLWIYNTKYKMLGVYNAKDDMGFGINSTTLLNFDEKTSICKTVRKPEEALNAFMKAGKVELRKFLDQFKTTETKLASRLNDGIVLLKVIK